jgi:hypothetical protein
LAKLKGGIGTAVVVFCVAGAMPGIVFAIDGMLRAPAQIGTTVLLALAVGAAAGYLATGVANVLAWHGGRLAARRWPRPAAVVLASVAATTAALLLAAQIG